MRFRLGRVTLACVLLGLGLGACKGEAGEKLTVGAASVSSTSSSTTSTSTTTSVVPTTPSTSAPPAPTVVAAARPTPPATRMVFDTAFRPFATAGGELTVHFPTARVEVVGFHESNRYGARQLEPLPETGRQVDMESRERATAGRGAADIESDPDGEVRAPVTGTVKRGGAYTLYCKYTDHFLVIAPDGRPDWEVKLLHIDTLLVQVGQRVEAGVTPVATRPTRLPFKSQAEDYSAAPAWPHVHLEVVDPAIKNPPGVGGKGCS